MRDLWKVIPCSITHNTRPNIYYVLAKKDDSIEKIKETIKKKLINSNEFIFHARLVDININIDVT